ncbi:MAG TPA: serine hydrolase domain-containing protein [Anaerolineales bacterium]|nr:serine hydrolase domain-containing protein [Anaerolineales bacterium]
MHKEIEILAQTVIEQFGVAGMAIGIVREGQIYAEGFGVRNIETQEPVTASSLFHLASISKTFVATALMQLVEQGKVNLDASIVQYLPDFRVDDERYRQITVRQMLTHTSGMPDTDDYGWDQPEYDDRALERYVHSLENERLIATPGEKFAYSNIAYEALGLLISRLSNQSFEDYIAQHLLRPLDMTSSTFLKMEVEPEHATTPHVVLPPTMVSPAYPYNRAHAPSSTLHSSALELCSWALMNLQRGEFRGQRILEATNFEQLWQPHRQTSPSHPVESVGLSWFIDTYRGHRRIRHDGMDVGFQSDLMLLPEQSLAVAVLANTLPAPVNTIAEAILDLLLGLEPEFPKPPILLPLAGILSEEGVAAAAHTYRSLEKTQADLYNFELEQFLDIGYTLLEVDQRARGLQVAQLGMHLFPTSPELTQLIEKLTRPGARASRPLEGLDTLPGET